MLRSEWLRTRQQLLAEVRRQVHSRLGREPSDLVSYIRRYNAEFSRPWRASSQKELLHALKEADVALGADFHAFAQSQRIHLRILRELKSKRPVVLALEAVAAAQQNFIDRFMSGELNETEFLAAVKWEQKWGFPWSNYRPLFELAREFGYRVVGLNMAATPANSRALAKRDRFCAEVIARWRRQIPNALIYVVIGDLHLAKGHLPAALSKKNPGLGLRANRVVTILQNSEHLYFRLARQGQEHQVEVMRSSGGRFCVLGSPPWVKWQSYLIYLEETYDRDLEAGGVDFTDYVASFAIFIARDLGLRPSLENLAVVTPEEFTRWDEVKRDLSPAERRLVEALVARERSFYLPQAEILFLARSSINHAASLAGQYLHAATCDLERPPWRFPQEFEAQIWVEAVGFFASKLINHKRKAESLDDLKRQLGERGAKREHRETLRLALGQRLSELANSLRRRSFRPRSKETYLDAARLVGHMLGGRLYQAVSLKRWSVEEFVESMQRDPLRGDFREFYYELVRRLDQRLARGRRG